YEHPASEFVAGFIGSPAMNFLPAEVVDDTHALIGGTHRVATSKARGQAGRPVRAGVRPEHLPLATDADKTAQRAIPVTVDLTEALGADTLI
ncbi:ABC transporter ATP-binding protein, partial [Planococcus sp. SIMBA_160]